MTTLKNMILSTALLSLTGISLASTVIIHAPNMETSAKIACSSKPTPQGLTLDSSITWSYLQVSYLADGVNTDTCTLYDNTNLIGKIKLNITDANDGSIEAVGAASKPYLINITKDNYDNYSLTISKQN